MVSEAALEVLEARAGDVKRGVAEAEGELMDARQVIIEPVVSEKSYALMADGKYTFRVDDRAHKTQISHAVEEIFGVTVVERADAEGALEAQAPRHAQRHDPRLEEGDRPARPRRADRAVRRRGGGE